MKAQTQGPKTAFYAYRAELRRGILKALIGMPSIGFTQAESTILELRKTLKCFASEEELERSATAMVKGKRA